MKQDFWPGVLATFLILVLFGLIIGMGVTQWNDTRAIICNDTCTLDRKIKQVEHCMTREVLTRIECVILVSSEN